MARFCQARWTGWWACLPAIGAVPFLGQRFVLMGTFLFIIIVLIIRPRGIGGLLDETRK